MDMSDSQNSVVLDTYQPCQYGSTAEGLGEDERDIDPEGEEVILVVVGLL